MGYVFARNTLKGTASENERFAAVTFNHGYCESKVLNFDILNVSEH